MKFMFVECEDVADAARFFEVVILPDFFADDRVIGMDEAKTLYHEWGGKRAGKNQITAIEKAVLNWNEKATN